jgi:hypothetical protein
MTQTIKTPVYGHEIPVYIEVTTTSAATMLNEQTETGNIFGYAAFFICEFSCKRDARVVCASIDADRLTF